MALQIWLPLIKDVTNQGLSNFIFTNSAPSMITLTTGGKIGSCYNFNSTSNNNGIYSADNGFMASYINNHSWSICAWVQSTSTDTCVISLSYGLRMFAGTTTSIALYNSSRTVNCVSSISTTDGKWHHLVATYDTTSNQVKFYVDGVCAQTTNYTSGYTYASSWTNGLFIGKDPNNSTVNDHYLYKGKMNDLRIYDHALSAKEVKELAKCLVLNYKLDDPGIGKDNLLSSYDTSFLSFALGPTTLFNNQMAGGTQEIVSGIGGATKCLHLHSNGGNNRQYGTLNCYAGNSYTVSCDYYSSVAQNTLPPFRGEMNGGDYVWTGSNAPAYTTPNQWVRLSFSYDALTSNATLYYFMMCAQGTDCYIKNIKIEKGLTSSPWVPAGQGGRLVAYDSSGFGYDGYLQSGRNIDVVTDSSRYSASTMFPLTSSQTGNYITMDNASFFSALSNCTITWWGKYKAAKSLLLTGQTTSHYLAAGNASFYNSTCTLTKWYVDGLAQGTPSYVANQWHFYAFTGTLNSWTKLMLNNYGGGDTWSINGQISDFRIYNTTLSDADILELYQTSASIDKNGNYYTRELVE